MSMCNARDEFIKAVQGKTVLCAIVECESQEANAELVLEHSSEEYIAFLELLNFEYDDGFGGQNLYGYIWYTDGTWSARGEYDGSEWWDYMEVPVIPDSLIPANKRESEQ